MRVDLAPLERHIIRMALRNYEIRMATWAEEEKEESLTVHRFSPTAKLWRDNADMANALIKKLGG